MRAWIATLAGLAGLSCGCSSSAPTERSPAPAKPAAPAPTAQAAPPAADARPAPPRRNDLPEGDIVTADVLEMNGANHGRPAATFRRGSVSPIPAPRDAQVPPP